MRLSRVDGHIFALLDDQAAISELQTGKYTSSLLATQDLRSLAHGWATVRWNPGHFQIKNTVADSRARSALAQLSRLHITPATISLSYLRRLMDDKRLALTERWWVNACPARYYELDLQMGRRKPPELSLPQRLLYELNAARSRHGNFAAFYRRLHHDDATLECTWGKETNPIHFIWCPEYIYRAFKITRFLPHNLKQAVSKAPDQPILCSKQGSPILR